MSNSDSKAVLARLWSVFGVESDSELTEAMDQKRSTVGNWRSRGTVPYAECVRVSEEKGISLDWLLTGRGQMKGTGLAPSTSVAPPENLEAEILELFRQMAPDAQIGLLQLLRQQNRIDSLEKQLKELQAAIASLIRSS